MEERRQGGGWGGRKVVPRGGTFLCNGCTAPCSLVVPDSLMAPLYRAVHARAKARQPIDTRACPSFGMRALAHTHAFMHSRTHTHAGGREQEKGEHEHGFPTHHRLRSCLLLAHA